MTVPTAPIYQDTMTVFTVLRVINIIISIIACLVIARYKGSSVVGWIFGGFILGLISSIIVAYFPHKD